MNTAEIIEFKTREVRNNIVGNRKRGFAAMYRSLLDNDWTKDAFMLAAWTRLVLRASSSEQTVNYNSQDWSISRGQLVIIPGRFANELCDRKGNPLSRDAAIRILKFFESQGMISMAGYDKGTVISIANYDQYQTLVNPILPAQLTAHDTAQPSAHHKLNDTKGLQDDTAHPTAQPCAHPTAPEEQPCREQPKDKDLNPYGPGTAEAIPDPVPEDEKIPLEAAVHERRGKRTLWGTQDDLRCAEWMSATRARAFHAKGLPEPKEPCLAGWANDIRLMRTNDNRNHQEICKLFAWVCRTGRELEFCQAPGKLRDKWDSLSLKRVNSEQGINSTKPMSNIAAAAAVARQIIDSGLGGYSDDTIL
jgi:hypothetical protein